MKKILILSFLTVILFSSCLVTGEPLSKGDTTYSEIIEVPDMTKGELFISTNAWAVRTFVNADAVIEFSDKEDGVIVGKFVGSTIVSGVYFGVPKSVVRIDIKDSRLRITFSDPLFAIEGSIMGGRYHSSKYRALTDSGVFEKIKSEWGMLTKDLKASTSVTEDW